ncbi:MAG: histidinol-phosphate transaminase, partial [Acidimicrobiia bacterium]|nr:histidinol-phosphate transaminase [Acidimicrobiia bacterium]
GLAWLVTWDEAVADAVCAAGERLLADALRAADVRSTLAAGGYAVLVDDPSAALAVVNAIAPEHLELQCAGAEELASRVDNAGAIFCGPWSPASVGDYVAGPSHVLPTYGSARFASALTVADFCKDHHVVTLDAEGIQRLGPHVVALADAEGLDAHAASVRLRLDRLAGGGEAAEPPGAASPLHPRPSVRDDLKTLEGYHSPQLTVEVRLNTNEAPEAPPEAFSRAVEAAVAGVEWHRYPDRAAIDLRAAIGAIHGLPGDQVFCANGSNEVIQTVLLAFAGPGRKVATFEPTYAMHAHIARITGAASVVGERRDDFTLDLDDVARVIAAERPAVTFLCSPNNPTGTVETEDSVRAVLAMVEAVGGLLFVDEAYGQFAPWSAATLLDDERALVVSRTFSKTWAMAGARLGYLLAPAWLVAELDKVVLPYHLDTLKQRAGLAALGFVDDMERRVSSIVEERGRIEATLRELGCEVWPSGANFVLFRPTRPGRQVWQGLVDRSVLVRDVSGWDRLDGCLRVTVGTAADNDRFLAGMTELLEEDAP